MTPAQFASKVRPRIITANIEGDVGAIDAIRNICLDSADIFQEHDPDFDRRAFHEACGWGQS